MKNFKLYLFPIGISLSLAIAIIVPPVMAAPIGPYIMVGGGAAFLSGNQLASTTITQHELSIYTTSYSISYSQKSLFNYVINGAFGYYFSHDPAATRAYGIEVGYNYFAPSKSQVDNALTIPFVKQPYPVTTTENTSTMSGDVVGVFSQDLGRHTSLILKLGAGYEYRTQQLTNVISGLPAQFPSEQKQSASGIGVAGGVGFQYNFSKHVAARIEFDGLMGGKHIGYGDGLLGLVFTF